ncbi:MAG TPA: TniQ family protein [Lacunisphaera sp.]|nr:TniQ family protein [Lacunisphaera sp.]
MPIEPGECLSSWILRIANRDTPNFQSFSTKWLGDPMRVTPGFDAFPAASLLMQLGAIPPDELDHYITRHTLLGTTKPFYTEDEWKALITTHGTEGSRIYSLRRKQKQEFWHICPACRSHQLLQGIATWQVLPQVPGALYCSEHNVPLAFSTSTRIPPLSAPTEGDLLPTPARAESTDIDHKEDHLTIARDVADAFKAGLPCRHTGRALRDAIAQPLFGGPWSPKLKIWPVLTKRFGEPFLDAVQVRTYHETQFHLGRLHPSYHGVVYLALLAKAFGTNLRALLATVSQNA